ncbi:phosphoribosyltransferase [Streptomyces sp. PR69]|uniref:phosphoribosyltransferase n=1 Tax=Streptomyces sp. PR69 TaxID=2984950 RepID=UPI002263E36F|nr:phosphoribosyltransferase [Streptomyces sp. PR69]
MRGETRPAARGEEKEHSTVSVWTGSWVAERLGVALAADGTGAPGAPRLEELLGLALRRNPKRAHLLVSNVLGKHVPQLPSVVYGAGLGLGERVRKLLGDADAARAVVLGYAETATGLGHAVADGLGLSPYLHSTRRPVAGVAQAGGFEESHSHATSHLLLPEDPELLAGPGPLVLVDDEFSTGNTVLNTIRALHARYPRARYVIVALADMRAPRDRSRLSGFAAEIGARVDLISLASGTVTLPDGVLEKGRELVARHESAPARSRGDADRVVRIELGWPEGLPDGGRHGFRPEHRARLEAALPSMAARIAEALAPGAGAGTDTGAGKGAGTAAGAAAAAPGAGPAGRSGPDVSGAVVDGGAPARASGPFASARAAAQSSRTPDGGTPARVLVLGCEELMYAPLRLGMALQERLGGDAEIRFSTTTRSPVLAVDHPGYAIRSRLVFPAHDDPADGPGDRYAYNVAGGGFDAVVAVVDSAADTPGLHASDGLLSQLAAHTERVVLAVVPAYEPRPRRGSLSHPHPHPHSRRTNPESAPMPVADLPDLPDLPDLAEQPDLPGPLRGPAFSSYPAEDVGWLLQDLSDAELEAPTEEREEAIQSGGAHYAESLPVEYQPSAQYQRLFQDALAASAARIARAVGTVTETVLAERSPRPVLVSLARAGTPVGVLMRRWAQHRHGLDLPHYAVSIVRGRGIDANALRWLARHHDPADVVFVDGWTGKGAITRELAAALAQFAESHGVAGFSPEIAVLADPGGCVRTYGTREDFLIPSACLNSTVSGLISRTVLRSDLVGPHDYHGAKFYRELAADDVSGLFTQTVAARFGEVAETVAADVKELLAADREPTWEGWAAVERISEEYGIHDVNLVKPGVGETTRVLLRRVPWKILARRGAGDDLAHIRLLAEQRGVPVEEVDGLPYSCVGLIHPRYTRGATGADGKAVTAP